MQSLECQYISNISYRLTSPKLFQIVEVNEARVGGALKEEVAESTDTQIYSTVHGHAADHREPQSHNVGETSGLHASQPDHRVPQRDKFPGSKSGSPGIQDSMKSRPLLKRPDSKADHAEQSPLPQSGPAAVSSSECSTVKQLAKSPNSVSGTTSAPSRVNPTLDKHQHGDLPPSRPPVEGSVVYPGPCGKVSSPASQVTQQRTLVKKSTKLVEPASVLASNPGTVNIARGQPVHKSPASLPKPSQALQHFQRAYTDERSISALQSGRNLMQALSARTGGHIGHHTVRTPHNCSQCGKGFSHLCHLRAHQQIHTGERQFCCSLCGRSFTKLSNLKAHRRVHTGERPYICMACGKRFNRSTHLRVHLRRHSRLSHQPHSILLLFIYMLFIFYIILNWANKQ
uniref:C2H2-type domain-containing protein n=1 Tax=Pygocentrus nattereri TaxID=42514 RepID=A0A3B4CCK4_PYGNA